MRAGSVCVSRARDAAAAARNSASGPPRDSDHTTRAAARLSGPGSSASARAARYQGPSAGGTSRRAMRSISGPPAAAMSSSTRSRSRPRGPRRGPVTIAARRRSSGIATGAGLPRARRRSSKASRSAARSVSPRLPDASTSMCANRRFSSTGICESTRARAASRSRPSRCISAPDLLLGCDSARPRGDRTAGATPASTRSAASVTTTPVGIVGPQADAPRLLVPYAGMHDGVQPCARRRVREDDVPEPLPVQAAVLGQDPGTESRHHVAVGRAARRHDLVRDPVQVEGGEAGRGQPPEDARLPAGDPPGQADPQGQARSPAAFTVFFMRSAMVRGPTPPGTGVSAPATSRTEGACTSPTSA